MSFITYTIFMTTGQSIRHHRLLAGLTQPELAARCGIPQAGLCRIERDQRDLTVGSLRNIAAALGITPDLLLSPSPPAFHPVASERAKRLPAPTREQMESLATLVAVGNNGSHDSLEASKHLPDWMLDWLDTWRTVIGGKSRQASDQTVYRAWNRIKSEWPAQTIRSMTQRIRDAESRAAA